MATVTLSIGAGTTHDETAAISAVSGSNPYTVTIAANSSVNGDALFDEHATPRKYLITAGGGTTSLTVRDSEGVGSAPDNSGTTASEIKRYYNGSTPITDWEADLDDTGLYGSGDDAVGECYNDAAFDESVTINGGGTVGLNSILLTVPTAERHDGTDGNGARVVRTSGTDVLSVTVAITATISWLEVDNGGLSNSACLLNNTTSATILTTFANCILHGSSAGGGNAIWGAYSKNGKTAYLNLVVYSIQQLGGGSGNDAYGIKHDTGSRPGQIANCTIHDIESDASTSAGEAICMQFTDDSANHSQQNIIATDPSTTGSAVIACYNQSSPSNIVSDHNLASDTTASGTGSLDSKTSSDQFVSNSSPYDLHLKSGADAIDAGTDLGTTPTGVEIDIDGRDRDAEGDTWDMGADELVAAIIETIFVISHNIFRKSIDLFTSSVIQG